jgi:hypothetical protein
MSSVSIENRAHNEASNSHHPSDEKKIFFGQKNFDWGENRLTLNFTIQANCFLQTKEMNSIQFVDAWNFQENEKYKKREGFFQKKIPLLTPSGSCHPQVPTLQCQPLRPKAKRKCGTNGIDASPVICPIQHMTILMEKCQKNIIKFRMAKNKQTMQENKKEKTSLHGENS